MAENSPNWIICFHCGRVSLGSEWEKRGYCWCPYDDCDGQEGDDLPYEEVRQCDASLPDIPERGTFYSPAKWWEKRKSSPEAIALREQYEERIENLARKLLGDCASQK